MLLPIGVFSPPKPSKFSPEKISARRYDIGGNLEVNVLVNFFFLVYTYPSIPISLGNLVLEGVEIRGLNMAERSNQPTNQSTISPVRAENYSPPQHSY